METLNWTFSDNKMAAGDTTARSTPALTAKHGYNENFRRSWFSWYKPIKSFGSLKASHVRTRSLAGFKGKDQGGNATKRSSMNILYTESTPRVHFLKRNLG